MEASRQKGKTIVLGVPKLKHMGIAFHSKIKILDLGICV